MKIVSRFNTRPESGGGRVLLDTNIFLEWLLGQQRADECRSLLERAQEGGIDVLVTDFALHSIAVIMERSGNKDELPGLFATLASFEGLSVLHASLEEHSAVARLALETSLDFDDAYHAYFAQLRGVPLISFDRHFDGIVERKTPQEVLL